jgi:DNA repair exonuclease SbcCD ATPase subunit
VDRRTTNLSGGEKFLVSLSLALGIADFARRNVRVESLFMDEGFGTLDDETLEDVMNCLKSQQRQGKMLGVITHVNELVDSISQRIAAESLADGHSALSGPGVSRG